jgi:hypothetical protein
VLLWLGVGGVRGGLGVRYSTVNVDGDDSPQWKSAISGWVPTNMFSKVPFSRGLRRMYRRSLARPCAQRVAEERGIPLRDFIG